ncbi:ArgE/DapE family deacylase [Ktedonosporobacter rubrisoli]|uniref:Probable succinyl-diaminopimelate desuccinylase n=1 Tax=Ktedonosporobacter rubrisoli TaxID=2509675 RepID=A0A4P6JII1_KTERU|nr:ArgE/DapE family deacylase [Ktedonosporobacter rubrisoli]QBD74875.1 ArgE/DapE family deacylase [Ktedonosporobacter rubrisoli]
MQQALRAIIAEHQESWIDFTKALIEIPSENPPGVAYRACVDLLAARLADLGLEYTLLEASTSSQSPAEPGYCLLSSYGQGEKTLYFHGHYDVVPASVPRQFQPYLADGKLFGRGSSDMKGGLVAMLAAVQAIKECNIPLRGKIGLAIVPDEETGGQRGAQYLAERGLLGSNGIGMLTAEPTDGNVWNANRGAISLRVRVKGKPAHVGLHYQGVNAFEHMLIVANALNEYKREISRSQTLFHIEPEAARSSILLLGGQSFGGSNFNVVPAVCTFTVDRRINPEEDLAEEKQHLLALFERLKGQGIELDIEIFQEAPSSGVSETYPLAQMLASTIATVTGKVPSFELCPGLLETRWYAQLGIPAFAYGPGLLSVSHGPHEYIPVKNIAECALIYAMTAVQLLNKD